MRISDWSSDVCSSDLLSLGQGREPVRAHVTQHMEFTISGSVDDERIFDNFATKWLVADLVTPRNRVPSIAQVFHAYTLSGASSIVDPSSCNNLPVARSEEHTSELQSLMRTSYSVFSLKHKNT